MQKIECNTFKTHNLVKMLTNSVKIQHDGMYKNIKNKVGIFHFPVGCLL